MTELNQLKELFYKCTSGDSNEAERAELIRQLNLPDNKDEAEHLLRELYDQADESNDFTTEKRLALAERILAEFPGETVNKGGETRYFSTMRWLRYAAALILVAGTITYIYSVRNTKNEVAQSEQSPPSELLPGGNNAVLTLSDGSEIVLSDAASGAIADQGGTKVIKQAGGVIAYQAGAATNQVLYNTIKTPIGGQYHVQLPDGSKVWLNALSSIKFPTTFTAKDRVVEVMGEVYFDISPKADAPFRVLINKTNFIEVLGTEFNVNAYDNETAISTTLINGRVKVVNAGNPGSPHAIVLNPGQQAQSKNSTVALSQNFNLEQTIAWKNGLFNFEGASLESVMRQLSRWYDIEVVYLNGIPDVNFVGTLDRNVNFSAVMKAFKGFGIQCTLEGNKLFIKS